MLRERQHIYIYIYIHIPDPFCWAGDSFLGAGALFSSIETEGPRPEVTKSPKSRKPQALRGLRGLGAMPFIFSLLISSETLNQLQEKAGFHFEKHAPPKPENPTSEKTLRL